MTYNRWYFTVKSEPCKQQASAFTFEIFDQSSQQHGPAVLPYSTQHYNSLPSIADAGSSLKPSDIDFLTTTIGQVFVNHKVQKLFGIILLHNHFSLDENETLVNIGSVAVPWKTPSLAEQSRDVKGSAWRFTEQGITPYEFSYDVSPQPDVSSFQPFISELRALLDRLGLMEKLGICVFTSEDLDLTTQVEFTQGRANITLPFDIAPEKGPDRSIEAVWQFDLSPELGTKRPTKTTPNPLVLKKFKVACKYGPNTGHQEDHKTTNK